MYKDIWISILKHLQDDLKSLASFTRVSKYFNILATDDYLWQYFCNKFEKDEIIEYKKENKEENWKQLYKTFTKTIKTIINDNFKIVLKGNNRCYFHNNFICHFHSHENENIEKQLLINDPEKKDKLLNIVNIYNDSMYWNNSFIILSNNKLFIVYIDSILYFNVKKILLNLELNDIIENVICILNFDFIIIKNLNIFKIFIWYRYSEEPKLIISLNYNIIDIIRKDRHHEIICSNQTIPIHNSSLWNILDS